MTQFIGLTNSRVVELWAAQTQSHGANAQKSFFFEGRVLYSYKRTWPIAILPATPQGKARVNSSHYSPTSSRHAALARGALETYIPLPVEKLREYISSRWM